MTSTKKTISGTDAFMHLITLVGVVLLVAMLLFTLATVVVMIAWSGFVIPVFGLAPLSPSEAFFAIVLLVVIRIIFAKTTKNEIRFKV